MNLPARLLARAAETPDVVALRHKRLGRWEQITWSQYARRAAHVGLGLEALGVGRGDRVAVCCENRPQWLLAELGAQGIGAVTVGIAPTSPAAELEYLLDHSGAVALVVDAGGQLDVALALRERVPALRNLVVVDPRGAPAGFPALEERVSAVDPEQWRAAVEVLHPSDTATIVYTSGTTGAPKGAQLTHANLEAAGAALCSALGTGPAGDVLSYLPLSYFAERSCSLVHALHAGFVVNFGEGPATFHADLREVQPTLFLGVPRVWEKLMADVEIRSGDAGAVKRTLCRACMHRGRTITRRGAARGTGWTDRAERGLLSALCLRALRAKLGLGRVRHAVAVGGPVAPAVLEWLQAIGVPVREAYGLAECAGIATLAPAGDVRMGSAGRPLAGVELQTAGDGEILMRSAAVFSGYHGDAATAVDADGWLHTSDVGSVDAEGFLRVGGRKDCGNRAAIESTLRASPFVRDAVVVAGDPGRLAALIGIERDAVAGWAGRHGVPFTTYGDLSRRPEVRALIGEVVAAVRPPTIERFALLPVELDHAAGHVTATHQVRRAAVAAQFAGLVDEDGG